MPDEGALGSALASVHRRKARGRPLPQNDLLPPRRHVRRESHWQAGKRGKRHHRAQKQIQRPSRAGLLQFPCSVEKHGQGFHSSHYVERIHMAVTFDLERAHITTAQLLVRLLQAPQLRVLSRRAQLAQSLHGLTSWPDYGVLASPTRASNYTSCMLTSL